MRREELTDEQWAAVEPLIPAAQRRADRRGRPWRDAREVLGGMLWALRNNAHWRDLPARFPPHQTCRRRFRQWLDDGTMRAVLEALELDLRVRGRLDVAECLLEEDFLKSVRGEAHAPAEGATWQMCTAALLLSPATRTLLRRTGSPLARKLSLPTASPHP